MSAGTAGAGAVRTGVGADAGVECTRLVSILVELFRIVASAASAIDRQTKIVARIAVVRVRKSAAPRALINPVGLPLDVRPPPSDRCIRMKATSAIVMSRWTTRRKVSMGSGR